MLHKKTCSTSVKANVRSHVSAKSVLFDSKLRTLKRLEGIWADKDTSFFDKKDA